MGKRSKARVLAAGLLCALLVAAVSAVCWPQGDVNYRCSDATWHVLLTVRAYDETPAAVHHFVPLVSLGAPDDKGIAWGATVPDAAGNYYYTSFPAVGFVLPWAFCKLTGLPAVESTLWLFGRLLLLLTCWALAALLRDVFSGGPHAGLLAGCGVLAYVLTPEVLHSTGVAYWPQAVFQPLFLCQVLAFRRMEHSRAARAAFYALCVLGPLVEWTAWPAAAGFFFAMLAARRRYTRVQKAGVPLAAAAGGALFVLHCASVMDLREMAANMAARYAARDLSSLEMLRRLLAGYKASFAALWVLLAALVLAAVLLPGPRRALCRHLRGNAVLYLVLLMPMAENLLMAEHAIDYTYDRMKLAFPLVVLLCGAGQALLAGVPKGASAPAAGRGAAAALAAAVVLAGTVNLWLYRTDAAAVWPAPFRADNRAMAALLAPYRDDSVMATSTECRGYMNLLFGRGIHEYCFYPEQFAADVARSGKRYGIYLEPYEASGMGNSMYAYADARLYDTQTGQWQTLYLYPPDTGTAG